MKLALITDWKGFSTVDHFGLSYHLVLAQFVLEGFKYVDYYRAKHDQGDFIMMDNGAAEDGSLSITQLTEAADKVGADEIILPDVLCDAEQTIKMATHPMVLEAIPPRKRAVVPQGDNADDWLKCANYFVEELEFSTLCVPKHAERFTGGRVKLLETIERLGWHNYYDVHLLGVWASPLEEVSKLVEAAPWARGLDTAAPFAWAQNGISFKVKDTGHLSHVWGKSFDKVVARANIEDLIVVMESS